jgi:hypothetical protein
LDKNRREVTDYKDIKYEIDCAKLSVAIKNLQDLLEEYGDVEIDISAQEDYGSSWYATVTIPVKRLETDEEVNRRITAEQRRYEWDRQQFEQLKKRFEK